MRFDSTIINQNLKNALALNAYENGDLSLGQQAGAPGLNKKEAIELLGELGDEFEELSRS